MLLGAAGIEAAIALLRVADKAHAEVQKMEQDNNLEPAIDAKIEATQLDLGDEKLYVSAAITLVKVAAPGTGCTTAAPALKPRC